MQIEWIIVIKIILQKTIKDYIENNKFIFIKIYKILRGDQHSLNLAESKTICILFTCLLSLKHVINGNTYKF